MKTRQEIKAEAKANFKGNYWKNVGCILLFTIIIAALGAISIGFIIIPHITVALVIFSLGMYRNGDFDLGNAFSVGFSNFFRKLGCFIVTAVFLALWTCLLVVPGIIKAFSYSMTEFILADCPEVKAFDAITLSRRMMDGHKWQFFVFCLSFIGWQILSGLTFGIVEIFYAGPYMQLSIAGFYEEVKKDAVACGRVTEGQLAGTEAV